MITKGDLQNRDGGSQVNGKRLEQSAAERLALLEERIGRARKLESSQHCADCFQRGRDAVLRLLTEP